MVRLMLGQFNQSMFCIYSTIYVSFNCINYTVVRHSSFDIVI